MSRETREWLATNVLVGFTSKRGNAWHYKEGDDNHYADEVPRGDVISLLDRARAVSGVLETNIVTEDGVLHVEDKSRQVIVRQDNGHVYGVFRDGYTIHQFTDWLPEYGLPIGSAGLLRGGAQAWVQYELQADNILTPEGVAFRPHLLANTSHDGSLATGLRTVCTVVVCDNTLAGALWEGLKGVKVKHTRYSENRSEEVAQVVRELEGVPESVAARIKTLCQTQVSQRQFEKWLDSLIPLPDDKGRARTMAENKREEIVSLYRNDLRVSPWAGTAYGVLAAADTYNRHSSIVRGMGRTERILQGTVDGTLDAAASAAMAELTKILALA